MEKGHGILYTAAYSATKTVKVTVTIPGASIKDGLDDQQEGADVTSHLIKSDAISAHSDVEAGVKAMLLCKSTFPEEEGWENHRVHIQRVLQWQIEQHCK